MKRLLLSLAIALPACGGVPFSASVLDGGGPGGQGGGLEAGIDGGETGPGSGEEAGAGRDGESEGDSGGGDGGLDEADSGPPPAFCCATDAGVWSCSGPGSEAWGCTPAAGAPISCGYAWTDAGPVFVSPADQSGACAAAGLECFDEDGRKGMTEVCQ